MAFFLFESFKRDVTEEVVPITAQATRVRREAIDFAAEIVRHAHEVVLKVTAAVWNRLHIGNLWERAARPPPFACA
ncbi:MAG TPA: hypothetical protein VLH75_06630 [Longimicrobiales bacterium]|nr:hypothetical protein [Longimicrobiales bacterium]